MKQRLFTVSVIVGLGVLFALAVVIFQFGRHNPSPPSLLKNPNPAIPGELIYFDRSGCIWRTQASGTSREEVYCTGMRDFGAPVVWVGDAEIAWLDYRSSGPTWTVVDLQTKQTRIVSLTTTPEKFPGVGAQSPDGRTTVVADDDGKVFLVEGGVRTEIADFDVARYSRPEPVLWSPDGQWIVLKYYQRDELWIISRDGRTQGTIATDAMGIPSWRIGSQISPQVSGLN
jgi:hypothetical protein